MLNLTPKKTFILLLTAFVMTVALARCSKEKALNQPGIGSIHGVRIMIPAEYKFFPVEYQGDEIWANPPRRHAPGPDVPISSFSLLLHFPDFRPLKSENRASWVGLNGREAKYNEWIVIGAERITGIGRDSSKWFSGFIGRRMDAEIDWRRKKGWHFERQAELVNDLVYEKKIGPDYSKISGDNVDIFYDANRSTTYIVCGAGAGGAKSCDQWFVIENLGLLVRAYYARKNLDKWMEIQRHVVELIDSFSSETDR
ncbi:hypothetical protein SAMN05444172_3148 [Burkholderia sp. GAS332]|nr:hypothetical protein SAMN05444172_3148 [Burkholderia sp. GAS332]